VKDFFYKIIFLLFLYFQNIFVLNAQIFQHPLPEKHYENQGILINKKKITSNSFQKTTSTLSLPFFDDFSITFGSPDPNLWIKGGGTRVGNETSIKPPSKEVVQFDGLKFSGVPYNIKNQLAQGITDTLTSQNINLSTYLPQDSVYLSFFFQPKGLGEQPDGPEGDSLWVEFKTTDTTWAKVWSKGGTYDSLTTKFTKVIIPIKDLIYFVPAFQFRFRALGRQSGGYDTWQLDYVYINKNRDKNKYFRDLAATTQPTNLLKRYASMPIRQFLANRSGETADTVVTFLKNNNDSLGNFNFPSFNFTISNLTSGTVYDNQNFLPVFINRSERQRKVVTPNLSTIPSTNKPIILKSTFNFNTGDNSSYIPGIDFRMNDTISSVTYLTNYFAYDDGVAEYSGGINQRLGRVAIQFHANVPDTLTAIQFYLPQIGRSLVGQSFIMLVLKKLDNNPSSILYQSSINIDSVNLNKYSTFPLDTTKLLIVSDTFYVGWQQIATTDLLNVGLDKNNPNAEKYIYYNLGGNNSPWQPSIDLNGAFMVRPVFGSRTNVISATEDDIAINNFKVYPNPTTGNINWTGLNINEVVVYDILGNKIFEKNKILFSENSIDLSKKADGIYIIHFISGNRKIIRKVILLK